MLSQASEIERKKAMFENKQAGISRSIRDLNLKHLASSPQNRKTIPPNQIQPANTREPKHRACNPPETSLNPCPPSSPASLRYNRSRPSTSPGPGREKTFFHGKTRLPRIFTPPPPSSLVYRAQFSETNQSPWSRGGPWEEEEMEGEEEALDAY